jgi:hypothetical protein
MVSMTTGKDFEGLMEEYGDLILPRQPGKEWRRALIPSMYGFYLNGLKVSMLNMFEMSYVVPELAMHAPDLVRGAWWIPTALGRSAGSLALEQLSNLTHRVAHTPRWWKSKARSNHVLSYLHDAVDPGTIATQHGETGGGLAHVNAKAVDMYLKATGVQATESWLRAFMFDVFNRRAKTHGLSEKDAAYEASILTGHVVGSFNRMGQSPKMESDAARALLILQRYSLSKMGEMGVHAGAIANRMGLNQSPNVQPQVRPAVDQIEVDDPREREALGRVSKVAGKYGMRNEYGKAAGRRSLQWAAGHVMQMGLMYPLAKKLLEWMGYRYKNFWDVWDPYYLREFGSVTAAALLDMTKVLHGAFGAAVGTATGQEMLSPKAKAEAMSALKNLGMLGVATAPGLSPAAGMAYRVSKRKPPRRDNKFSKEGFGSGSNDFDSWDK